MPKFTTGRAMSFSTIRMEKTLIAEELKDKSLVYEVSFLLLPSLASEQVPGKAASLKEILTSLGGEVLSGEDPVLIDLAYPMLKIIQTVRHKVNTGYFGWIKFEISKEGIGKVKKALDANDDIVRYLIIKTVRENTLLNGRMKLAKEEKVRKDEDVEADEVAPESTKETTVEELDKSIDNLVIV